MKWLVSILLIGAVGAGFSYYWFSNFRSGTEDQIEIIDVSPGRGFHSVLQELKDKNLIASQELTRLYARLTGLDTQLKVGEYEIPRSLSTPEILGTLTSGKGKLISITVPEGTNLYELAALLASKGLGTEQEYRNTFTNKNLIAQLLGPSSNGIESLEGYLFPETYNFTKYSSSEEVARTMVKRFLLVYGDLAGEPPLRLNRHQVVTLASVIEKETGAPEERPRIASVFFNRLRLPMRLQSDPTILYGLLVESGEMKKNIKRDDILKPTPYNTYTVNGLPKGPIANPGKEALMAVFNPEQSDFLYFVSRNDGTHVFSRTLKEHNQAVRQFQLDRKQREGKSWRNMRRGSS